MSILKLQDISLTFNNKNILQNIHFEIAAGDFIILLGSNGSGKSSLLKLIHRDYHPNTGRIYLLDKSIMQYASKDFRNKVAVLTQNSADSLFSALTIFENYLLAKHSTLLAIDDHKTEREFLVNYLQDFNPKLSQNLDIIVEQLSGGEKQALALAFCLLRPPALLLLDEHTSALDPKTSKQIMQLTQKMINQHHITCILTTHDLDIAMDYGNRILILREGEMHKTFIKNEHMQLSKEILLGNYF